MSARRRTMAIFAVVEVMEDQTEFVTGEKVRLVLRENGDVTWARVREVEGDA